MYFWDYHGRSVGAALLLGYNGRRVETIRGPRRRQIAGGGQQHCNKQHPIAWNSTDIDQGKRSLVACGVRNAKKRLSPIR